MEQESLIFKYKLDICTLTEARLEVDKRNLDEGRIILVMVEEMDCINRDLIVSQNVSKALHEQKVINE